MARLYADENFPLPAVEALQRLGHDVLTVQEASLSNQSVSDETVLSFAHTEQRMVLTFNRKHFVKLHNEHVAHAGIIVCTVDSDFTGLAQRIHLAIEEHSEIASPLIRVNRPAR